MKKPDIFANFYERIFNFYQLLSGNSSVNVTVTFSTARREVVLAITSLDARTVEKQTIRFLNKETFLKAEAVITQFHISRHENFSIDALRQLILKAVDEKLPLIENTYHLETKLFPLGEGFFPGSKNFNPQEKVMTRITFSKNPLMFSAEVFIQSIKPGVGLKSIFHRIFHATNVENWNTAVWKIHHALTEGQLLHSEFTAMDVITTLTNTGFKKDQLFDS